MEKDFIEITKSLRQPAGEAERFATLASIKENRSEFTARCHDTWKRLHEKAVYEIVTFDAFLAREKVHPVGPIVKRFGEYNRAVWRKVNDAIVWPLLGMHRHVVKRLCLYRRRNFLSDSNADHVMSTIGMLNSDPMSFAMWNDATSCVDIGDITYIGPGLSQPVFIELKEGVVNDAILNLIKDDSLEARQAFAEQYGQKGMDQLDRVLRQNTIGDQALTLLRDERGIDPVTGRWLQVVEASAPQYGYDEFLNNLLRPALASAVEIVEKLECLWVFINTKKKGRERLDWMLNSLRENLGREMLPGKQRWESDRFASLNEGIKVPMAMPLFFRGLDADVCASVLFGELRECIYFYFDWEEFARIVASEGGTFAWSSEKEARRMRARPLNEQPLIVRGRAPLIVAGEARVNFFATSLVQVFFDGLSPRSLAKQFIDTAHKLPDLAKENGNQVH